MDKGVLVAKKHGGFQVPDLNQKIKKNKSLLCNKKILTQNLTHKEFKNRM
jgi:hypothetical protein